MCIRDRILVFCILSAILISRLFYLQIVKGDYYLENYKMQIRKTREIPGTRGNIYDRNGNLLAYNELAYSVTFEDTLASGSEKNQTLNKILEQVIEIVESHGDSAVSYTHLAGGGGRILSGNPGGCAGGQLCDAGTVGDAGV